MLRIAVSAYSPPPCHRHRHWGTVGYTWPLGRPDQLGTKEMLVNYLHVCLSIYHLTYMPILMLRTLIRLPTSQSTNLPSTGIEQKEADHA